MTTQFLRYRARRLYDDRLGLRYEVVEMTDREMRAVLHQIIEDIDEGRLKLPRRSSRALPVGGSVLVAALGLGLVGCSGSKPTTVTPAPTETVEPKPAPTETSTTPSPPPAPTETKPVDPGPTPDYMAPDPAPQPMYGVPL